MALLVETNVNSLLAVGDAGQAAQLITALGSILNTIGDEDDTEEGRETRSEVWNQDDISSFYASSAK